LPTVKIGIARQVVIPKAIHDRLGLSPGDRLDVSIRGRQVILTPKSAVEKRLERALADEQAGRLKGAYESADAMLDSLAKRKKKIRKRPPS
jgi:AbrB family looped-hinge helix DNA binding protein